VRRRPSSSAPKLRSSSPADPPPPSPLSAIPFTPPNVDEEYLRFHTTKTWPLEEESPEPCVVVLRPPVLQLESDADPSSASVPSLPVLVLAPRFPYLHCPFFRTWVTMSAPIARLPLDSPAAKHKFLLLISPDYYHPFRPSNFSLSHNFHAMHANQPRNDRARHRVHKSARERHEAEQVTQSSLPPTLHTEQAPRVGGHTPANVPYPAFNRKTGAWSTGFRRVDEDQQFTRSLAEREGEDADGWFVVRSKKFGYQLQNKKWCVDMLRRLVEAANVSLALSGDVVVPFSKHDRALTSLLR
jgi:hypothetical protein